MVVNIFPIVFVSLSTRPFHVLCVGYVSYWEACFLFSTIHMIGLINNLQIPQNASIAIPRNYAGLTYDIDKITGQL